MTSFQGDSLSWRKAGFAYRELPDSSDALDSEERCRTMAQKWRGAEDNRKNGEHPSAMACMFGKSVRRMVCSGQLENALTLRKTRAQIEHRAMAARLLGTHRSHARCGASSHGCRTGCFGSGRINRSSSEFYFAVANGCCFYTLRATGPYPVETQALCLGHQPYVVLVAFLGTTRFWRSAQTCNRIHRIGG